MVRTQIQLTEAQSEKLKRLAAQQNTSVADLIRQSVDLYLSSTTHIDREEQKRKALEIVGKFNSGVSDLGINHDKYLAEAYEDWK